MFLKDALTWAAIVMFGVSASLWYLSTVVTVSAQKAIEDYRKAGFSGSPAQIIDENGNDVMSTGDRRNRWSRAAAVATAMALIIQAGATYVTAYCG